jgi:hypothetical protein
MNAMTDEEVEKFEAQHHWATGLNIAEDGRGLYYDNVEANCIELKFPETPMQVPYFTRVLSLLDTESEERFGGALLWITYSTSGPLQLEKIGWKLVEKMRLAFGETRPISLAPGHWFRSDEFVELNAFLLPCFVFGWDAYLAPSGKDYFVHISHDEFWMVVTKTAAVYNRILEQLKSLNPQPPHPRRLERFCRRNSPQTENRS